MQQQVDDIENRLSYLESEFTDKDEYYALDNRIDKLENNIRMVDVYLYVSVFYVLYLVSKQLNNLL